MGLEAEIPVGERIVATIDQFLQRKEVIAGFRHLGESGVPLLIFGFRSRHD